jgi:hypothetical protein
MDSSN